ncbi:MAG: hypothetical protein KDE27_03965 [Planctomycetes bacterium]|nr:hypothetical protein [Planctomycetota bacterium]
MSTREHKAAAAGASGPTRNFREAVAQWRLAVHTEVKKVSSLPTAMFDATDPMLEMRLAESTEVMLAQLCVPDPHLADGGSDGERRLERIDFDELRTVPERIAARPDAKVDLLSQLTGEYLGILADSCCMQEGIAKQRAVEHLCADFGVTTENLDDTIKELHRLTLEADVDSRRSREYTEIARVVEQVADVLRQQLGAETDGSTVDRRTPGAEA